MSDLNQSEAPTTPEPSALDAVIEQSKAALATENQVSVKNPGGRPKGSRDKKPRKNAGAQKPKTAPTAGTNQTPDFDNQASAAPELAPPLPDLTPFLGPLIATPFTIAANKSGFEGFRLSDEEQKALAPQVQAVLNQYFPKVANSPHAPLMMLAGSIGVLGVTRYMGFMAWQTEMENQRQKAAEAAAPKTEKTPNEVFPTVQVGV